jgi:signal transduction histidine kinase/streptogramin lyase
MGSFTVFTTKDGLVFGKISSAIQDREGYLWFGTVGCGVSRYDGHTFNTFTARDGLGHTGVISLFQDREGELWFGTFGGGVSHYDGRAFTTYTRQDGLDGDFVYSIYQDRQGSLWFGTEQGVSRYVRPGRAGGAGTFTTFTPRDGLSGDYVHAICQNPVYAICQDPQGVYWFGTLGGGLSRYDGKTFSTFSREDGLAGNFVFAVLQDRKGDLWIGTWEGVSRADPLRLARPRSGQASGDLGPAFTTFTVRDGLTNNFVYSISQDRDGRLWFGTQGGACRYDGGTFLTFTHEDGLAPNAVISVLQDPRGHLWFAVDGGGMVRHDGQAFQTLLQKDGLGSNGMSNAVVQDREGNLWFGTIEGATRYRPPTPSPPPIFINAVVADRRYERASQVSIPSSVELTAFEFQGISLKTRPEAMVYRYRLRGHDPDWRTTHARRVEYQDLPRGNYTFEVEAVDRDLVYSSAPATVTLQVRMPYERIGWMSALGIALVLATYQTRRVIRRDRRLQKSNEDLRKEVAERQRVERERARLVSLGQMVAGVAHELNQPLTVISGAAEDVYLRLAEGIGISEEQLKEKMKDVLDLAERMTGTIEHLRVFSRDISKEPGVPFSVNDAIRSGLRLIETQLRNHSIALHLDLGEGLPPVSGHPHRMEQVFLNLLSNARDALDEKEKERAGERESGRVGSGPHPPPDLQKSLKPPPSPVRTGEGGGLGVGEGLIPDPRPQGGGWTKGLWIRTRVEGEWVVAEVEDNGVGMDEAHRARLFEPFFTTKPADRGTGLGLSISHAIVRDHGGQITCESWKGEGTVFRVRLPTAGET